MILGAEVSRDLEPTAATNFWRWFLKEKELQGCDPLEKLLAGCEIIAALDGVDLLTA